MTEQKIVIVGCGGHGRVILDILRNSKDMKAIGFVDDDTKLTGISINDTKVIGTTSVLRQLLGDGANGMVLGIGNNDVRAKLFFKWKEIGFTMINAIHPRSIIAKDVLKWAASLPS